MRTLVALALFLGADAGCGTDATVSGVFPAEGFTGRTMRVEISGDATEWSGSPGVNMGQGVTVSNVTVASPTSLFVDITIDASASLGTRDITVSNDGTFTLKSSFLIESPIELLFDGVVAQGGAPYFAINNRDIETPFDLTSGDTPSGFANLELTTPGGTQFVVTDSTAYQLKGYALIDADATPGPVSIASGFTGHEVAFNLGADVDITARSPMALTDGATGTLAATGDSQLYAVSIAASPSLMRVTASTSNPDGKPITSLLPGGHWMNASGASLAVVNGAGSVDVVVFDAGTAGGYNYNVASKVEALASAAEPSSANDTPASALDATALPFAQVPAELSAATDQDVIKVVLATAGVIHVSAHSTDDLTDTAVDILSNAGGNPSVLTNYTTVPVNQAVCIPVFGIGCGEDVTSPMVPAGTYFVVISAGDDFVSTDQAYTALVFLN
ncbi:MAG TPA: hypothetical protein VL326_19085 [Kofleriaceae bacterium]|jgi:hypothetical protein|nr:hypothetical protein [Kofleriaceae bacterium]